MVAFSSRSMLYKLAFMGVIVFFGMYLVGFATPNWIDHTHVVISRGLWIACGFDPNLNHTVCVSIGVSNQQLAWFHVVRAFEVVGMLILFGACVYGVAINCCCSAPRPFTRKLEIIVIVGGVCSFVGAMIFVGKFYEGNTSSQKLSWSNYLADVGSALVIVCGIALAIGNRRSASDGPAGTSGMIMGNVAP